MIILDYQVSNIFCHFPNFKTLMLPKVYGGCVGFAV